MTFHILRRYIHPRPFVNRSHESAKDIFAVFKRVIIDWKTSCLKASQNIILRGVLLKEKRHRIYLVRQPFSHNP